MSVHPLKLNCEEHLNRTSMWQLLASFRNGSDQQANLAVFGIHRIQQGNPVHTIFAA